MGNLFWFFRSIIGLSLGATVAAAPPVDVSSDLAAIAESSKIPGMVAAAIVDDSIVLTGATGVRRRGSSGLVLLTDRFHLGSCTKAMTATLIAGLVEDGVLSWSTTVGDVFGGDIESIDEGWRGVTIDQLLCMRAGAPADLNADGLWTRLCDSSAAPPEQRRMLVEGVITRAPKHAPASEFLYSNASFAIAGAMAEKKTGAAWEDLMLTRIASPLHMSFAGFGAPGRSVESPDDPIDQPRGHAPDGQAIPPGPGADNPPAIGPAGTFHCSIEDWARFIGVHLRAGAASTDGSLAGPALLKPETFVHLHTPFPAHDQSRYGFGWVFDERHWAGQDGSGPVLTHSGSNTMWFCVTWLAPERNLAVLVACNSGEAAAPTACDKAAWMLIQKALAASASKVPAK